MKKKSRKKLVAILLIILITACVGVRYLYLSQVRAADEGQEIVLEAGQELTYAKIISISGNEMDYIILEARTADLNETGGDRKADREKGDGDMPVGAEGQGKKLSSDENNAGDAQSMTITTYTETEGTGKMQIPVGTEVETKLGTVTTFSRLSSGDIIRMLLQKDDAGINVPIKIWIVE